MERFYQTLNPTVLGARGHLNVFREVAVFKYSNDCARVDAAMKLADAFLEHRHNPAAVLPFLIHLAETAAGKREPT